MRKVWRLDRVATEKNILRNWDKQFWGAFPSTFLLPRGSIRTFANICFAVWFKQTILRVFGHAFSGSKSWNLLPEPRFLFLFKGNYQSYLSACLQEEKSKMKPTMLTGPVQLQLNWLGISECECATFNKLKVNEKRKPSTSICCNWDKKDEKHHKGVMSI